MAYATAEEFARYCAGQSVDADTLAVLLQQASDQIDAACFGRIRRAGFEWLTAHQQECIQKAVCLHTAWLAAYGEALESPLASYGINGVSMAFDNTRTMQQGGVTMGRQVYSMLLQSGLAHRGIW